MNTTVVAIVAIYFLILIGMGAFTYFRKPKEEVEGENQYVGSRSLGTGALVGTIVAAWASSNTILAASESGFLGGASGPIWYAIALVVPFILFIWPINIIKKIREAEPQGVTLIEYLGNRFDEKTRVLGLIVILVAGILFIISAVLATGIFLASLINVSVTTATIIGGVVLIIYTSLGGFEGTARSHTFQVTLAALSIFVALLMITRLDSGDVLNNITSDGSLNLLGWGPVSMLDFIIVLFGMTFANPAIWQRFFAARESKMAERAIVWTIPILIPFAVGSGMLGVVAFSIMPDIVPSQSATEIVMGTFPNWAAIIFLLGALALVLSSADSVINNISSVVQHDLIKRYRKTPLSKKQSFNLGLVLQIAIGVIGVIGSLAFESILELLVINASFYLALLFPLYLGLTWKKTTSTAAFWSLLVSFILGSVLIISGVGTLSTLITMLLSGIIIIGLSLITDNKEVEKIKTGDLSYKPAIGIIISLLIYAGLYVIASINEGATLVVPPITLDILVYGSMVGSILIIIFLPLAYYKTKE